MIDPSEISSGLRPASSDLWIAEPSESVSYMNDGNSVYSSFEDASFWFRHRNQCVLHAMKLFPPRSPLFDIGGGNGIVSLAIQKSGCSCIVLEPGPEGARNALARGLRPVIQSTFESAKFHPKSMPSAGLFDVLEHLEDDQGHLEKLSKTLSPSGRLFLTVPAFNWLWSHEDVVAGHFRRYSRPTLVRELNEAGFTVEYSTYFFSFLVFPILILRTLPNLFGMRQDKSLKEREKEHIPAGICQQKIANWLIRLEMWFIGQGWRLPFGTSLLAVARVGKFDNG